jgi:hypothetical protein
MQKPVLGHASEKGEVMVQPIVRAEDWPHGLRCADCDTEMGDGDLYSEQLTGIAGESGDRPLFTVRIVCISCGLGLRETAST